jgi:metacaspase-1
MSNQFDKGHALVVGVADYLHVSKLPNNVLDDARDVADLLRARDYGGYPSANVEILLDGQATLEGIRMALGRLVQSASDDDTVIFFFSGHGARVENGSDAGEYLLAVDSDVNNPGGTALKGDEVTATLKTIKAKRLVVLLDACHSAGTADLKSANLGLGIKAGLGGKTYDALSQGVGRVVLASSRPSEFSYVLPGMRNSLFTHHLLDALRGSALDRGDGLIRVFDVFHYVSGKVSAQETNQHPVFKANDMEDNFPLALRLGGKQAAYPPAKPDYNRRSVALDPKTRLALQKSLVTRWSDLATYFDVPLPDRATFLQGQEPRMLLDWLEQRKRLAGLPDAFNYLGYDDLIEELNHHP